MAVGEPDYLVTIGLYRMQKVLFREGESRGGSACWEAWGKGDDEIFNDFGGDQFKSDVDDE